MDIFNFWTKSKSGVSTMSKREIDKQFAKYIKSNKIQVNAISNRDECSAVIELLCEQIREHENKYDYIPFLAHKLLAKFILVEQHTFIKSSN